jgi:hypothetical protein
MIEKYSYYEFEVLPSDDVWIYVIFDPNYKPSLQSILRESDEWFDTETKARCGAMDHIDALENGER